MGGATTFFLHLTARWDLLLSRAHSNKIHGDDGPHLLSRRFYGRIGSETGLFGYTLTCSKAQLGGDGDCYFSKAFGSDGRALFLVSTFGLLRMLHIMRWGLALYI